MSKKIAVLAGSFDPFTNGHFNLTQRAQSLFGEVHLLVATSPNKAGWIPKEQRVQSIQDLFEKDTSVRVMEYDGLVAEYQVKGCETVLVRGIRDSVDLALEQKLAFANQEISPKLQTIWLPCAEDLRFVSSSLLREMNSYGKSVEKFLPSVVFQSLSQAGILCSD